MRLRASDAVTASAGLRAALRSDGVAIPRSLAWLAGFCVLVIVASALRPIVYPGCNFDPVRWRDPACVAEGVRFAMLDCMMAVGSWKGRTRAEIVAMLGESEPEARVEEAELGYYVGLQRRGFVFDRMWMVVSFCLDGSTSPVRVVKGL
ncbi:MAG: hypothetical protein ACK501_00390 [Planctomycetota bacterium]|jgi:hypothetical protein